MGTSRALAFVRQHPKALLAVAAPLVHAFAYTSANQWPLFPAIELPLGPLDLAVPFIPATIWIYVSDYLLVLVAFLVCAQTTRFALAGFSVIATCVAAQWVWPTTFPRQLYPVQAGDGLSEWALVLLRAFDRPGSCFPSLHVALSSVSALAVWRAPPTWHPRAVSWGLMGWTAAVCVSTLTLKQHYAVDVAGGLVVAGVVHALTAPGIADRVKALALRPRHA